MDMNNNLVNMTPKVKCDFCEKSFFGEFLSKHMRVSHPGVERPKKKKSSEIKLQPMENANQSNCNNTFSNFSCTFLNPNNFFQFEFELFKFIRFEKPPGTS